MNKQKSGNCFKVLSIMALGSFLAISTPADAAKNNKEKAGQPFQNKKWEYNIKETHNIGSLKMIGEQRIPFKKEFQGTVVGGLSGLSYNAKQGTWMMISDDKSDNSPARFYTAQLNYDNKNFNSVTLTGMDFLKQANGTNYPNQTQYAIKGGEVPDFESIRLDPKDGSVWYTSEGSRSLGLNPFIKHANGEGKYLATLPLAKQFNMIPEHEIGPRDNLTFEGMTFANDGNSLWVSMEAPLYQDGPVPTTTNGALSRITQYDRKGKLLAQYAYPIDAIPAKPGPGKYADNGVSEILSVNKHKLLTIERSGVQSADGTFKNYIRIYELDTRGASDISNIHSLQGQKFKPVKKRLVLDLTTLGLSVLDNIEGISWGPKLPNGHDSLVLVSDDNFNRNQVTQFLAFEVLPK
ncbi:esterase-like activity of phytase family protein [Priestia megaterium]|uniref:esterase-like activity of phytase family protein n=1 Tax=Priestia megaterium TaxID=1404 RepID=UPI002E1EBB52|nr:esterase-like activity of phytase family protein [Priestia megaterium]